MSALFDTPKAPNPQPPPRPPQLSQAQISKRASDTQRERAMVGRASQFMSDPSTQTITGPDATRYLTGG